MDITLAPLRRRLDQQQGAVGAGPRMRQCPGVAWYAYSRRACLVSASSVSGVPARSRYAGLAQTTR